MFDEKNPPRGTKAGWKVLTVGETAALIATPSALTVARSAYSRLTTQPQTMCRQPLPGLLNRLAHGCCERLKDPARFRLFANLLAEESRYRSGVSHATAGEQIRETL